MTQTKTTVLHCLIILSHCHLSSSRVPCDLRPWETDCRSEVLSDGNVTTHPLQQGKYIVDELGTQGVGDLSTVKTKVPLSGVCSKNRKILNSSTQVQDQSRLPVFSAAQHCLSIFPDRQK